MLTQEKKMRCLLWPTSSTAYAVRPLEQMDEREATLPADENPLSWWQKPCVSVLVAGTKLEKTDGQDFAIPFGAVKLEIVKEVKVTFEGEDQEKSLIASYCSHLYTVPTCKPLTTDGVSLQVEERNVSLILQHVNISRSGHYKAQAFCGKDVDEITVTLVVNKASFRCTTSRAPTHTSTLKPPTSSEHQGLLTAAAIIIIIIVVFCFICKWRKILCFKKKKKNCV